LSVSCAGVNSWVDLYNDHGSAGSGWCAGAEESRSVCQLSKLQQVWLVSLQLGFAVSSVDEPEVWLRGPLKRRDSESYFSRSLH
jgi:hypothetical protein